MSESLTLKDATAFIARAEKEAARNGWAMTFAVVDAGGHLVALHRMDGTPWISVDIAIGKAWTSAAWQRDSALEGEKAKGLPQFSTAISVMTAGRYTPQIGGVAIRRGDAVVGAAGASGATGQQDEQVVKAALETFA